MISELGRAMEGKICLKLDSKLGNFSFITYKKGNSMRKLFIAAAASAFIMTGCVSTSKPETMVAAMSAKTTLSPTSKLRQSVSLGDVTGGKKTNPLWVSKVNSPEFAEALKSSLVAHAMLATDSGTYKLDAELKKLKQPFVGTSMTVTSTVNYTLTNTATGEVVFSEDVVTPYKAAMKDSWVGAERLRLANEGSIRSNISSVIELMISKVDGMGDKMAMN